MLKKNIMSRTQLTPEVITKILKDRHHNKFTMAQLKEKFKVGNKTIKNIIDDYSEKYLELFPLKQDPKMSLATLQEFWANTSGNIQHSNCLN